MFISKRKYRAVAAEMARQIVARDDTIMLREANIGRLERKAEAGAQSIRALDSLAAKYKQERDTARAEAAANAADAQLWRNAREKRKQGRAAA